jgi:aminopeptidase N
MRTLPGIMALVALLALLPALAPVAARAAWIPAQGQDAPKFRWDGRIPSSDPRGFDVQHADYILDLVDLPPDDPFVTGTAALTIRLLDPAPALLRLDFVDDYEVSEVLRDGDPVPFTHVGDTLTVALPDPPQAGAEHVVRLSWSGSPPRHGPFRAGLLLRQQRDGPSVGNVNQPYSTHSWLPCKDHPADKSTLAMTVTAPDSLTVVANGRLLGTEALPGERTRWSWRTDHPIAPYLIGLMASPFVSRHENCAGLRLEYHSFAEHVVDADSAYARTCDMVTHFEDLFGPYPFRDEKYAQAEFVWFGAMENQTVSAMGQAALLLPTRNAELIVAHELAHHWFGNSLTPTLWRDLWLNEGFARYCEMLWVEHAEGHASYLAEMQRLRRDDLFVGDGLLGDPDPVLPNIMVYDKGAWVLHMLRGWLGDDDFFAFLRAYATHPELVYALTDRERFAVVGREVTGRDVGAFLRPWLETEAVPELAVRWRPDGGGTLVEVVQRQGAPAFPLVVPVRVHAGSETIDRELRMDDLLAGTRVMTAAPVDSVVIDPDGWLLWRSATTAPPQLLAAQPRPNPSVGQTTLAYWLAAADRVEAAVYDARGRRVWKGSLGAQPATGPREDGGEPRTWVWDGRDRAGRSVAAGVYWLELRTARDRSVRKVTLLR